MQFADMSATVHTWTLRGSQKQLDLQRSPDNPNTSIRKPHLDICRIRWKSSDYQTEEGATSIIPDTRTPWPHLRAA